MRATIISGALLFLLTGSLAAQEDKLARLDPQLAAQVRPLIDAAAARSLPTEPLIQKALEGHAKKAATSAVVAAVASYSERLAAAQSALGSASAEADLVAGASALYVGVAPASLRRLRTLQPDQSLAMPLIALAFFVQRGLARDASVGLIEQLVSARITEPDIRRLQELVDADVRAGAPIAKSSAARVQSLLSRR